MSQLKIFTNANLYIDGGSRIGQVEEFTSPTIAQKMQEVTGLGLTANAMVAVGLEPMEATLKFAGVYGNTFKLVADPDKKTQYQLRGNIDVIDATGKVEQKPYLATLLAACSEFNTGAAKKSENPGMEAKLNVFFYELQIEGEPIVKVDLDNHIYEVAGKDKLAAYKGNLGI
jgi:P2 family phage contractile tail tube protein